MFLIFISAIISLAAAQESKYVPPPLGGFVPSSNDIMFDTDTILLGMTGGSEAFCKALKSPKTKTYTSEEISKIQKIIEDRQFRRIHGLVNEELEEVIKNYGTDLPVPEMGYSLEGHQYLVKVPISTMFSELQIYDLFDRDMKYLLGENYNKTCDAAEYRPNRQDPKLMAFPNLSCHSMCRFCFSGSVPICLRENQDNNFKKTCLCTFDATKPVENPIFTITDSSLKSLDQENVEPRYKLTKAVLRRYR